MGTNDPVNVYVGDLSYLSVYKFIYDVPLTKI